MEEFVEVDAGSPPAQAAMTAYASSGRPTVRLDTNPVLLEAIAMYRRNGYRDIERYNDNPYAGLWFEKTLS